MTVTTFPSSSMGEAALQYAARGVKIFPLWWPTANHGCACTTSHGCACADGPECGSPGKHPITRNGVTAATTDPHLITEWWIRDPDANIGMPADANGLAILDVDPGHGGDDVLAGLIAHCTRHGVDLLATRLLRSGGGGLHALYRAPKGGIKSSAKTFGPRGVDTRGRGGYIVAPPSLHASGSRYEIIQNGHQLAPWPACLTDLIDQERHTATPAPDGLGPGRAPTPMTATRTLSWAAAGLAHECQELMGMTQPDSGRNNRLNAAAYKMGRRVGAGLLDEAHAFTELCRAVSHWRGHTAREIEATVRSGLTAGKARPHGGPAPRTHS